MKGESFLACLIFLEFFLQVKCDFDTKVYFENRTCIHSFKNGGYEEFVSALPLFNRCLEKFHQPATLFIKFINYSLPAFPNQTFINLPALKSFRLEISSGSDVQILSPLIPGYSVFKNMKFQSAMIDVCDSQSLNGWKWEALSEIESNEIRDFQFIAYKSKITRLPPSFGEIAGRQVTAIRITNCQLRALSENVFSPLSKLAVLELRNNLIEKFKRFHLPRDAAALHTLDLG